MVTLTGILGIRVLCFLFGQIISVCGENQNKLTTTAARGQNTNILSTGAGGAYAYHCALMD